MQELGKNIYGNFKPHRPSKNSQTNVRAVVIGTSGSGQTSLLNNMCNTHYKTISSRMVTKEIIYEDVVHIEGNKFRLYDTPAYQFEYAYEHALILRTCLKTVPYNLILVQTRLKSNFGRSLPQLIFLTKMLNGYESNIVYLLSYLDIVQNQQQKQQEKQILDQLMEYFDQNLNKNKIILYSNRNSDFSTLAKILYDIATSNVPKKIQISDNTFYKYFRKEYYSGLMWQQRYKEEIQDQCSIFMNFAYCLEPTTQDLEQIVPELKIFMKHHMKQLQHKQYQQYQFSFRNEKTGNFFLMISRYLQDEFQKLDEICDKIVRKIVFDGQTKKKVDIRDMIKQCPICEQIWMKDSGSERITYCGDRPNTYDCIQKREIYSFIFQISNERLTYTKKKINNVTGDMIKREKFSQKEIFSNLKQVGCGGIMNWKKLPRIPNIEELLKQLYSVSNYEQIKLELDEIYKKNVQYKEKLDRAVQKTYDVMKKDNLQLSPNDKDQKINEPEQKIPKYEFSYSFEINQPSKNIYSANFRQSGEFFIPKNLPKISTVLIGESGMGKSKLVNKLCGSKYEKGTEKFKSQTCQYINSFEITDSPSFEKKTEEIIEKVRNQFKWRTVFVLTKLTEQNCNQIFPKLRNILEIFQNQNIEIVIMLTQLDALQQNTRLDTLTNFYYSFAQFGFTQKLIIFSNQNSEFDELSRLMFSICLCNEREHNKSLKNSL